ncbi:Thyroid adenoma-associated protein-like protein, partial [Stegodyphus mimosarum]
MLSENRSLMKLLFEYIVHHREHFIDSLRHLCRDLFKSLLNLHILTIDMEACQSPLIKELTLFLLKELPYHNRGKYGLISCIVEIIGTEQILIWHPSLPEELYKALTEVSLVTHISDVCENLFKHSSADEPSFQHVWLNPLLKCLYSGSKEQMIAVDEHILPKLLKVKPFSIHFLMSELSYMWENNIGNCFSALISCVKFSEKLKISKSSEMLSTASLMKALCHADDQIRLSAFSLLCESQKTTAPVPFETLKLIKFSLPCNINCQSPSFR